MFKKLILAAVVVIGSVAAAQTSDAGDCYRGYSRGHSHGHSYRYSYARRPVVSVGVPTYGVYRPPLYGYPGSLYRSYSPYGGGYIGPGVGIGYRGISPYYGGRGLSIGIGF